MTGKEIGLEQLRSQFLAPTHHLTGVEEDFRRNRFDIKAEELLQEVPPGFIYSRPGPRQRGQFDLFNWWMSLSHSLKGCLSPHEGAGEYFIPHRDFEHMIFLLAAKHAALHNTNAAIRGSRVTPPYIRGSCVENLGNNYANKKYPIDIYEWETCRQLELPFFAGGEYSPFAYELMTGVIQKVKSQKLEKHTSPNPTSLAEHIVECDGTKYQPNVDVYFPFPENTPDGVVAACTDSLHGIVAKFLEREPAHENGTNHTQKKRQGLSKIEKPGFALLSIPATRAYPTANIIVKRSDSDNKRDLRRNTTSHDRAMTANIIWSARSLNNTHGAGQAPYSVSVGLDFSAENVITLDRENVIELDYEEPADIITQKIGRIVRKETALLTHICTRLFNGRLYPSRDMANQLETVGRKTAEKIENEKSSGKDTQPMTIEDRAHTAYDLFVAFLTQPHSFLKILETLEKGGFKLCPRLNIQEIRQRLMDAKLLGFHTMTYYESKVAEIGLDICVAKLLGVDQVKDPKSKPDLVNGPFIVNDCQSFLSCVDLFDVSPPNN